MSKELRKNLVFPETKSKYASCLSENHKNTKDFNNLLNKGKSMKELTTNDNIGFGPPAAERPFQRVFDQMMTKPAYNINMRSNNPWVPYMGEDMRTVNNRSSVAHNIISPHLSNKLSGVLDLSLIHI